MSIKLKISVTEYIISKSLLCGKGDSNSINTSCAIALAIRDIFPLARVEERGIFLDNESFKKFGSDNIDGDIPLPPEASDFIVEFDNASINERLDMKPISFEIEIPDEVICQINIDEVRPLLQNHPTLELIEQ
jgi:hypothetical protein